MGDSRRSYLYSEASRVSVLGNATREVVLRPLGWKVTDRHIIPKIMYLFAVLEMFHDGPGAVIEIRLSL